MNTKLFEEMNNDSSSGKFDAFANLKSDANKLPYTSRFLLISVAGNVKCVNEKGDTVTVPVAVGRADLRIQQLIATGTTADGTVCF